MKVGSAETLIQSYPENTFAWITLWATIEHVRQPVELLQRIHSRLKPGGYLAMTTGLFGDGIERLIGGRSQWMDPPQHIWCFSRQSMVAMLERLGYVNIRVTPWITFHGLAFDKLFYALRLLKHAGKRFLGRRALTADGKNSTGTEMFVTAQRRPL